MILLYHKVYPESPTMWWVEADAFRRQMLELRGRKVVYLDDYDPADPGQVVITFDGVYQDILRFAGPVLSDLGYPFELFVTGEHVGRDNAFDSVEPPARFADEATLARLQALGGRLQWHGAAHVGLGEVLDAAAIERELSVPQSLRRLDPAGFRWFAYPHGTLNPTVLALVRARFAGALSCHQGNDSDRHCLNRVIAVNESSFRPARFSVIVPCYNYGTYLAEAVESLLRQTLPPQEILLSDDASTDDTPLVMDALKRRHGERLRVHRNKANMGIVAHFNQAAAMTSGDYLCFLGADNRFRSDFLERTVGLLDRRPDAGVAYTDFALFGPRAPIVTRAFSEQFPTEEREGFHIVRFPDFTEESKARLLARQNFMHGSSLIRRKAFEQAGGYQEAGSGEDWNLFQRVVAAGWSAVRAPFPLLEYRQHSRDQASVRLASEVGAINMREAYRELRAAHDDLVLRYEEVSKLWSWRLVAPLRYVERRVRRRLARWRSA